MSNATSIRSQGDDEARSPTKGLRRWLAWFALACSSAVAVYLLTFRWQARDELGAAGNRLELVAEVLQTELSRHEALPGVVALDPRIRAVLSRPADNELIENLNAYLAEVQARAGAEAVYLLDKTGLTIASSNAGQADSFVGQNYAFRPYVAQALAGSTGRFYAIGTTTGRPGYFLATSLREPSGALGVVAVKVSLLEFEQSLSVVPWATLVVDEHNVAVLASDARLRYRSLTPLSGADRANIKATRQFDGEALAPIFAARSTADRWTAADADTEQVIGSSRQVISRSVGERKWRIVSFAATPYARSLAGVAAGLAFITVLGAGLFVQAVSLRRARRRDLLEREAEIRSRIQSGTQHLRKQLAEQERTEAMLRATTDSAVQAGKLTVLGQMAAAMSHELNQPLTAVRTFADNAVVLLDAGNTTALRRNLDRIAMLAERMGQIIGQLRTHSRKNPGPLVPVGVTAVVDAALLLLTTAKRDVAAIRVSIEPENLVVVAQHVRLEQVLINLLRNALDATPCTGPPEIRAIASDEHAVIEILDRGPGISADAMPHLFEPFFTTKPTEQGLGLGLAVSKMIVQELHGDLVAANSPTGGAVFRIRLPLAVGGRTVVDARGALIS